MLPKTFLASRKPLVGFLALAAGCVVGLSVPALAQRGGNQNRQPGTPVSATYKGLAATREYQPMPTTAKAADGKIVTTTYPAIHVVPIDDDLRTAYRIDKFYSKTLTIGGVVIMGSDKVSDWAFLEAAYTLDHQLHSSPQWVHDALTTNKIRLAILAEVEYTMDLPENSRQANTVADKSFQDTRSRGLGGMPWCSCAEENLLNLPRDPYGGNGAQGSGENITIHEFSHTVASAIGVYQGTPAWAAMEAKLKAEIAADPIASTQPFNPKGGAIGGGLANAPAPVGGGQGARGGGRQNGPFWAGLNKAFADANQVGGRLEVFNRNRGNNKVYASNNTQEYWAEGAQAWFDNANPGNSGGISKRQDVKDKDPELAILLAEVYGDQEWRYFKTTAKKPDGTTLRPPEELLHLAGLDAVRSKFPTFNFSNSPRVIADIMAQRAAATQPTTQPATQPAPGGRGQGRGAGGQGGAQRGQGQGGGAAGAAGGATPAGGGN